MNIDQYRAMKAEEETRTKEQTTPQPAQTTEPPVQQPPAEPVVEPVVQPATPEPEVKPIDKVVIDGEELTVDQIKEFKAGYSRTQDYTKKTQEAARIKREAENALKIVDQLRSNPQASLQLGIALPTQEQEELARAQNRLVEQEIEMMQLKYPDFDPASALDLASSRPGLNLEDAYVLLQRNKPTVPPVATQTPQLDIEEIKKQIRADMLKALEATRTSTSTIISSNDAVTPTRAADDIDLTPAQLEYCRKTGTSQEDYKKDLKMMMSRRK